MRAAAWGLFLALVACGPGSGAPMPDGEGGSTILVQDSPEALEGYVWEKVWPEYSFSRPLWVGPWPGGGHAVLEQGGVLWRLPETGGRSIVLDLSAQTRRSHNEEGFLSVAFHPSKAELYAMWSASDPRRNRIARFLIRDEVVDAGSMELLFEIEQPYGNHNGGHLAFGPDGYLYLSLGDGGAAGDPLEASQDLSTLLGKLLRLNVDLGSDSLSYAIPTDNPFLDQPGARPEIWALGLRNLWRFSFDSQSGDCWGGDVGQDDHEEINRLIVGGNYGWDEREGAFPYEGGGGGPFIEPVLDYGRRLARSITGGVIYRGERLPALEGAYIHGDYDTGLLWAWWPESASPSQPRGLGSIARPASFGVDAEGEVLLCSFDGFIYRLEGRP